MINLNLDKQILGRWVSTEIEYIFSKNKTFQIVNPNSDKIVCGYYNIKENGIDFILNDYSRTLNFSIEYLDYEELRIEHVSNEINKKYNLKKIIDNYKLKKFNAFGNTSLDAVLCLKNSFYPILLMNDELENSLHFNHFEKPQKPEFTKIKPEKPNSFLFYFLFLMIGVLIFIYFKKPLGLIIIVLGIAFMYTNPLKKNYITKYEDYQKNKRNFDNQFKKYKNEISLNEEDFLLLKNKEKITSLLRKTKYTIGNDYIKGISHSFFLEKLLLNFGSKINQSKGILESVTKLNNDFQYKTNSSFRPYISDFAYVNDEIGLVILIEIDEPYTIQNREPIHLNDNDRNSFFLELNWIIIRFSEEQILNNTNECCEFISQVILKFEQPSKKFNLYNPLPIIAKWNQFDIYRLINSNYRENYLKMNQDKF